MCDELLPSCYLQESLHVSSLSMIVEYLTVSIFELVPPEFIEMLGYVDIFIRFGPLPAVVLTFTVDA